MTSLNVTLCDCGGSTTVLQSRQCYGNIRRRRKCLSCGERWSTVEVRKVFHEPKPKAETNVNR